MENVRARKKWHGGQERRRTAAAAGRALATRLSSCVGPSYRLSDVGFGMFTLFELDGVGSSVSHVGIQLGQAFNSTLANPIFEVE